MTDKNGIPKSLEPSSDLADFEQRLNKVKAQHEPDQNDAESGSLLGMAWRLSTELVVAVLVGAGLGHLLDRLLGTGPWILLVGLGFGFAAGIMTVLRTAEKMDAATSDVPIGEDLTDTEEDF